jgi:hypothetical protein
MAGLITDFLAQGTAAARPATPSAAAGTLSFYFASDTEVLSIYDWNDAAWQNVSSGAAAGSLIGIQTITTTGAGTYTPTTGTNSIVIELVGAGGGGGAVASPTGTNTAIGLGGGGGAYVRKRLTAAFSGASYSVGAKGTGGTAGANAGNNGGDTTFTATGGGGAVYTAGGGGGGSAGSAAAAPTVLAGGAAGTPTNGDVLHRGGPASDGFAISTSSLVGSRGGGTYFTPAGPSTGVLATTNTQAAGVAASTTDRRGCGGSGAMATGTGTAQAGGDGSDGMIIIWEYS